MSKIKSFDYNKVEKPEHKIEKKVGETTVVIDLTDTNKILRHIAAKQDEPLDISITLKII